MNKKKVPPAIIRKYFSPYSGEKDNERSRTNEFMYVLHMYISACHREANRSAK